MKYYTQKKFVIFCNDNTPMFVKYYDVTHIVNTSSIIFLKNTQFDNYMGRLNAITAITIMATTCFVPAT